MDSSLRADQPNSSQEMPPHCRPAALTLAGSTGSHWGAPFQGMGEVDCRSIKYDHPESWPRLNL
jgi:hypothetical protein